MNSIINRIPRWVLPCLLGLPTACESEDADLIEVLDEETGRVGYVASSPAGVKALLDRVDAGEIAAEPAVLSALHELVHETDLAADDQAPRNMPSCPSANATTKTYRNSFGIWGLQYVASAEWKKIGFGPHRPVRAEATVCGPPSDCVTDVQIGTPLNVTVSLMVPLSEDGPVYASAKIIDTKNGESCVASSAFQYWP